MNILCLQSWMRLGGAKCQDNQEMQFCFMTRTTAIKVHTDHRYLSTDKVDLYMAGCKMRALWAWAYARLAWWADLGSGLRA
jgi:hypothetical protein